MYRHIHSLSFSIYIYMYRHAYMHKQTVQHGPSKETSSGSSDCCCSSCLNETLSPKRKA